MRLIYFLSSRIIHFYQLRNKITYKRTLKAILALTIIFIFLLSGNNRLLAQNIIEGDDGDIKYINLSVITQFPESIEFNFSSEKPLPYEVLTLKYKILGTKATQVESLLINQYESLNETIKIKTNNSESYIPPGAEIEYWYEISTMRKNIFSSLKKSLILTDQRYDWKVIKNQNDYIYYHDYDDKSAELILEKAKNTYTDMSELFAMKSDNSIRITLYNSWQELKTILPPRSEVQENSLITEGMSFGDTGVIILLGNRDNILGVTMHETVHFAFRNAMGSVSWPIPAWLNEGLAEYANTQSNGNYATILAQAIKNNSLFPITSLTTFPGKPDDVILAYGQSKSIVTFLIKSYGATPFQELVENLHKGNHIDIALKNAYGLNRFEIDNDWRESIGAKKIAPIIKTSSLPTSIPQSIPIPSNPKTFQIPSKNSNSEGSSCTFRSSNSSEIGLTGGLLFLLFFHNVKAKQRTTKTNKVNRKKL